MSWHHSNSTQRKFNCRESWHHDNGNKIYQGRPDGNTFIYLLVDIDGKEIGRYTMLRTAKVAGEA